MQAPALNIDDETRLPPGRLRDRPCRRGGIDCAHLPAYRAHGLDVLACYDLNPDIVRRLAAKHIIGRVYEALDALLADQR